METVKRDLNVNARNENRMPCMKNMLVGLSRDCTQPGKESINLKTCH